MTIRYISPVVTARTITQAEKDASRERRAAQRKRRVKVAK